MWASNWTSGNPAVFEVYVNGTRIARYAMPSTRGTWFEITGNWNSGTSSTATLEIVDTIKQSTMGDDFAIDDISFVGADPSEQVTSPPPPPSNNPSIGQIYTVAGNGTLWL